MIREDILAMEVDGWALKLSSEVAVQIMGWHRHSVTKVWLDGDGNRAAHWRWSSETNIQDAWQVVEKMEELGFYFKLDSWGVEFYASGADMDKNTVVFDALVSRLVSGAICKAALLAKERYG